MVLDWLITDLQVAELTREWAEKWQDIQRIIKVHSYIHVFQKPWSNWSLLLRNSWQPLCTLSRYVRLLLNLMFWGLWPNISPSNCMGGCFFRFTVLPSSEFPYFTVVTAESVTCTMNRAFRSACSLAHAHVKFWWKTVFGISLQRGSSQPTLSSHHPQPTSSLPLLF